ncbi:30S ribosomal protein S16 [Streptosporangium lutulentum]|uniref:Small ribosomal subunit protein bS16 n=1 Tax=Streptosporangium lutulentum TaxID=1461250 RepID=A0ABT9QJB2_9ACTN|nr:30S ribosomal protein S16 [Streptosporangium lutulentum]MDP9846039.1 small subunit ribosomal protein S16 [Streptosporangium lutulentum]
MAVKIKLKRLGMIRNPQYRIVIADSRTKRDGRAIEEIGLYHPKENPSRIEVNSERAAYWLGVGAQPTEPVLKLLKLTGDWQKFKGEPAPAPLLVAEPKADRHAVYESAAKEALSLEAATTPKKTTRKAAAKADEPAAEAPAEPVAVAEEKPAAEEKPEGEA